MFINLGNAKLKLLHPPGPDSPINNVLDKNPSGGVHRIQLYRGRQHRRCGGLPVAAAGALSERAQVGAHGGLVPPPQGLRQRPGGVKADGAPVGGGIL